MIVGPNNFDRNPRYAYGRSLEARNQLVFRDSQDCTLTGLHLAHVTDSPAALSLVRCDRFHVQGLTILDCPRALLLEDVSRSRISDCFLRSDNGGKDNDSETETHAVLLTGGTDNEFDESVLKELVKE